MTNTKLDTKLLLAGASLPLITLRRKLAQKKEEKEEKRVKEVIPSKHAVA